MKFPSKRNLFVDAILEWVADKPENDEFHYKEIERFLFEKFPVEYGRLTVRQAVNELLQNGILVKTIHTNNKGKKVVTGWYKYSGE